MRLYGPWRARLAEHAEVVPVELPGRGTRIHERPVTRVEDLVADVRRQILPSAGRPFAVFGHSLGGILAFELARVLEHQHGILPRHLLVSGTGVPDGRRLSDSDFLLPDRQFRARLRELNGTPPEVLDSDELMDLLLPVLRADFAAAARWRYRPSRPLSCPVTVFGGTSDREVAAEALHGWSRHTTASCRVHLLPGDHFFLHEPTDSLLRLVADRIGPDRAGTTREGQLAGE